MIEWLKEDGWVSDWMIELLKDGLVSDWMIEWLKYGFVSDWMIQWLKDEWLKRWMIKWLNDNRMDKLTNLHPGIFCANLKQRIRHKHTDNASDYTTVTISHLEWAAVGDPTQS